MLQRDVSDNRAIGKYGELLQSARKHPTRGLVGIQHTRQAYCRYHHRKGNDITEAYVEWDGKSTLDVAAFV